MEKIFVQNVADRSSFINKVFLFFAIALLIASGGVFGGITLLAMYPNVFLHPAVTIGMFIALLGMSFTVHAWENKLPLGYALFVLYALISGATLAPLLAYAGALGGVALIGKALLSATFTFVAAALWGWITRKDLSSLGGILFVALIGIIVVSVINMFLQTSLIEQIVSAVGIVVFTLYVAYDIQSIKERYHDTMFLSAAMALYLDFVNLFVSILRFFIASRD